MKIAGIHSISDKFEDHFDIVSTYKEFCDEIIFVSDQEDFCEGVSVFDKIDNFNYIEGVINCCLWAKKKECEWIVHIPPKARLSRTSIDKDFINKRIHEMTALNAEILLAPLYIENEGEWERTGFFHPIIYKNIVDDNNKDLWNKDSKIVVCCEGVYSYFNEGVFHFDIDENNKVSINGVAHGDAICFRTPDPVFLSVVIPYYKKIHGFVKTICKNYWMKDSRCEIVIVMDEPSEEALVRDLIIENFKDRINFRVIVNNQDHEWRPPCKALNVGIKHSLGNYIGVISPETMVMLPYKEYLYDKLQSLGNQYLHGFIRDMDLNDSFQKMDEYGDQYKDLYDKFDWEISPERTSHLGTFFINKSHLESVGCYNENWKTWGGDDDDVRKRIQDQGVLPSVDDQIKAIHNSEKDSTIKRINYYEDDVRYNDGWSKDSSWGNDFNNVVFDWNINLDKMKRLEEGEYDIVHVTRSYTKNYSIHKIIDNISMHTPYSSEIYSFDEITDREIFYNFVNKVRPKILHLHSYFLPSEEELSSRLNYKPYIIHTVHSDMESSYKNVADVICCIHTPAYEKNKDRNAIVIENSVNVNKGRIEREWRKSPRKVVSSCRFDEANISRRLCVRYNNIGTQVDIYGHDGTIPRSREVKFHCEECRYLDKNIKIYPWNHQMESVLPKYDIFAFIKEEEHLSPERCVGLNVMEAVSLGIPCIISKKSFYDQEYVIDGYNGFQVDDHDQFFALLELMVWDDELYAELKKNALDLAFQIKNNMPESYKSIYSRVLKR